MDINVMYNLSDFAAAADRYVSTKEAFNKDPKIEAIKQATQDKTERTAVRKDIKKNTDHGRAYKKEQKQFKIVGRNLFDQGCSKEEMLKAVEGKPALVTAKVEKWFACFNK